MGVEFVDDLPPSAGHWNGARRREVKAFAEELKRNPGRWAVYPWKTTEMAARAVASRISLGKVTQFKLGFEAVSRRGTVYVRYVGEGDE